MSTLSPPTSPSTPAKMVTEDLIQKVTAYVRTYMSNYDPSHDYNHIRRVSRLAQQLHTAETSTSSSDSDSQTPGPAPDAAVVRLAALLHDVGDKKYLREGEDAATMVRDVLLGFGAGEELAARVQAICLGVSYSSEVRDPGRVRELIELYPERESQPLLHIHVHAHTLFVPILTKSPEAPFSPQVDDVSRGPN